MKWSDAEKEILVTCHRAGHTFVLRQLAAAGYSRSRDACYKKALRLGLTKMRQTALLSLTEAAELLEVPVHVLYGRAQRGTLKTKRRGKYRYITLDTFDELQALFPSRPARTYTFAQVQQKLWYSQTHILRMLAAGLIQGVKWGEVWLIDADHFDRNLPALQANGIRLKAG
jgi:hypothetical protein